MTNDLLSQVRCKVASIKGELDVHLSSCIDCSPAEGLYCSYAAIILREKTHYQKREEMILRLKEIFEP